MRLLRLSALVGAASVALTIASAPAALAEAGNRGPHFGPRHHFNNAVAHRWFHHRRHRWNRWNRWNRRNGNGGEPVPIPDEVVTPEEQPASTGGDTTGGGAVPTTGGGGPGGAIGGGDIVVIEAQ
jgi:hypothetical protein